MDVHQEPDYIRAHTPYTDQTFESFVETETNKSALRAAQRMAKHPCRIGHSRVLHIQGGSGAGKTHLLHAIKHQASAQGKLVDYVDSETFVNEYIDAIRSNRLQRFRENYRSCELLLLDDLGFLEEKPKLTKEIVFMLKHLLRQGSSVVVTSSGISLSGWGYSEQLTSVLAQAVVVFLEEPQSSDAIQMLNKIATAWGLDLKPEMIAYLSYGWHGDVRWLEGILDNWAFHSEPKGKLSENNEGEGPLRYVAQELEWGASKLYLQKKQPKSAIREDLR